MVPAGAAGRRMNCMKGPSHSTRDWTPALPGASMGQEEAALERVEAGAEPAMVKGVFGSGAQPQRGHRSRWAVVRG